MFLEVYRFSIEWDIMEFFYKIGNEFLNIFNVIVSEFGSSIIMLVVATLIYWCINKEAGKKICFTAFYAACSMNIFKGLFSAKRPFQYEGKEYLRKTKESLDSATGTSFPSGHAVNSSTFYSQIAYWFKKNIITILAIVLTVLVVFSRLYLGVHFPGDVLVGIVFGLLISFVFGFIFTKYYDKRFIINICAIVILLPFFILFLNKLNVKDFYKGFGLVVGFLISDFVEEKKINFTVSKNLKTNILRYVFGMILTGVAYLGAHLINHMSFIESNITLLYISCTVTHLLLTIIAGVLVPYLFTKIKFLQD